MEKVSEEENKIDEKEQISQVCYDEDSTAICLSLCKDEYDHVFERSNKLDNKVNIALTFCGFIFVFITGLFQFIYKFEYPTSVTQLVLIVIYIVLCLIIVISYVHILMKFVSLLTPNELQRVDSSYVLEKNYYENPSGALNIFLATNYCKSINRNNNIIESRFIEYKKCIKSIIPIVIISFVLYFLQILIQTK